MIQKWSALEKIYEAFCPESAMFKPEVRCRKL